MEYNISFQLKRFDTSLMFFYMWRLTTLPNVHIHIDKPLLIIIIS